MALDPELFELYRRLFERFKADESYEQITKSPEFRSLFIRRGEAMKDDYEEFGKELETRYKLAIGSWHAFLDQLDAERAEGEANN